MLKHEEIQNMVLFKEPGGFQRFLSAPAGMEMNVSNVETVVHTSVAVNSKFEQLLLAAPLLYRQLTMQHDLHQMLINIVEQAGDPDGRFVQLLREANTAILTTQQAAQVGAEKILSMMQQESMQKGKRP